MHSVKTRIYNNYSQNTVRRKISGSQSYRNIYKEDIEKEMMALKKLFVIPPLIITLIMSHFPLTHPTKELIAAGCCSHHQVIFHLFGGSRRCI